MSLNKDQSTKVIDVLPGATVEGDLSSGGVLRFERRGNAMTGKPVLSMENGKLALQYADGSTVHVKTQ